MSIKENVDDFLEHHGVKGQKWGQRRNKKTQANIDRLHRVASGTASFKDKARVSSQLGRIGSNRLPKAAETALKKGAETQKKMNHGQMVVQNILLGVRGIKIADLNFHQNK